MSTTTNPAASLSVDKPTYAPGDTITATLVHPPQVDTLPGTAGSSILSVSVTTKTPATCGPDSAGRVYTLVSDDGSTAVYTAKA